MNVYTVHKGCTVQQYCTIQYIHVYTCVNTVRICVSHEVLVHICYYDTTSSLVSIINNIVFTSSFTVFTCIQMMIS